MERLSGDARERFAPATPAPTAATATAAPAAEPAPALAADESPVAPNVAEGIHVGFLDPAAPWAAEVGADTGGRRLQAALAARVHLFYDETAAGLKHDEEWEALFTPLEERFDPGTGVAVDYDDRDFRTQPPEEAVYVLPGAPLDRKSWFNSAESAIKDHLYRNRSIEIYKNRSLKLYSRVGEGRDEFAARCDRAAQEAADTEIAKERDSFESKLRRLKEQADTAARQLDDLQEQVTGKRRTEVLDGIGSLLGGLLGGRSTARTMSRASRRRSETRRTEQRRRSTEAKLESKLAEIQDLEEDLYAEVEQINDEWEEKAGDIETLEVGLEKQDIDVVGVTLVWVPVA